jgi:hypothetical protein
MMKIMSPGDADYFFPSRHAVVLQQKNIMKKNMGTIDKTIRILLALVIIVLYFTNIISGTLAIVGLIFSGIFILTSVISFCPLYLPFGISTRKEE